MNPPSPRLSANHNQLIIIYDGKCAMCSAFIGWIDGILKDCEDPTWILSSPDRQLLMQLKPTEEVLDQAMSLIDSTIIVLLNEHIYIKATAIGVIMSKSNNFFARQLAKLLRADRLGNSLGFIYDQVASNRLFLSGIFSKKCQTRFTHLKRWPEDLEL